MRSYNINRVLRGIAAGIAGLSLASLAACGAMGSSQAPAEDCYMALTGSQLSVLQPVVVTPAVYTSSAPTICVLQNVGGIYVTHYYSPLDHYGHYGDYWWLSHQHVVLGHPSLVQQILLTSLVGVNSHGAVYHMYSHSGSSWAHKTTLIRSYHVTKAQYGGHKAVSLAKSFGSAPKGYHKPTMVKSSGSYSFGTTKKTSTTGSGSGTTKKTGGGYTFKKTSGSTSHSTSHSVSHSSHH